MKPEFSRIYSEISAYKPVNEREEADKAVILSCLERFDDVFDRSNALCHMTASCWCVNAGMDKALMAYHNLYGSWAWLGGHADGDTDLLRVAMKECMEESGLGHVSPVTRDIYSLEVLTVDGHIKRGAYVPSHLHLNVTYLLKADESEPLCRKEDENKAVKWFPLKEAVAASTEKWFKENVYSKLNEKLVLFR